MVRLEDLGAAREHVVERVLEVRRILGELLPHLLDVFLVALLDLLAEALAQRALALALRVAIGEVRDDVGDERAREPLRLLIRIVGEERIDRRTRGRCAADLRRRGTRNRSSGARSDGGGCGRGRSRLRRGSRRGRRCSRCSRCGRCARRRRVALRAMRASARGAAGRCAGGAAGAAGDARVRARAPRASMAAVPMAARRATCAARPAARTRAPPRCSRQQVPRALLVPQATGGRRRGSGCSRRRCCGGNWRAHGVRRGAEAAGTAARSCGGVIADGRDGMLVSADVRGCCCVAGAPPCAAKPACIGCGGVGIDTGGRGGSGAATDGRCRAGVCDGCGAGDDAVKSSSMRPRSPIAITPPHTEHRARTPASGILAGSTRKTELHSGQVTFMRWRSRESCSVHCSETPTGEPRIGSCRRSTT